MLERNSKVLLPLIVILTIWMGLVLSGCPTSPTTGEGSPTPTPTPTATRLQLENLNKPGAIILDSSGNLYVFNEGGSTPGIRRYKADGNSFTSDTSWAGGDGVLKGDEGGGREFNSPIFGLNLATDSSDNLYVNDFMGIQKYDSTGTFSKEATIGATIFGNDLAVNSDGSNIYVISSFSVERYKVETNGSYVKDTDWSIDLPTGSSGQAIDLGSDGNIYLGASGDTFKVYKHDLTGNLTTSWGNDDAFAEDGFCWIADLVVGGSRIYVLDSNCNVVKVFDLSGKFIKKIEIVKEDGFSYYNEGGIALDSSGDLYITTTVDDTSGSGLVEKHEE